MIKPPWAASTWIIDETLYFDLPGPGHSHQVRFPATPEGFTAALKMLQERGEISTIGTKGDPTQWKLDRKAKVPEYDESKVRRVGRPRLKIAPELATAARDVLRRLGMI